MYRNRIRRRVRKFVGRCLPKHQQETQKEILLTAEMEEQFKTVICDTLKQCLGVYDYPYNGFADHLLFHTYDEEYIPIGCLDGENLLLDCDFMYRRLYFHWKQWRESHKEAPCLPKLADFYQALYNREILSRGKFFQKPCYQFSMEKDKTIEYHYFFSLKSVLSLTSITFSAFQNFNYLIMWLLSLLSSVID